MNVIGKVKENVIIVDDLVDTSGTLCKGADALREKGAAEIYAFCTHPVMSDKLVEKKVMKIHRSIKDYPSQKPNSSQSRLVCFGYDSSAHDQKTARKFRLSVKTTCLQWLSIVSFTSDQSRKCLIKLEFRL